MHVIMNKLINWLFNQICLNKTTESMQVIDKLYHFKIQVKAHSCQIRTNVDFTFS
jgi:hypothetical protein